MKYREGAPVPEDSAIIEMSKVASTAIIITKNASDYVVHHAPDGSTLLRIPAFAFLYLLGHMQKNGCAEL